MSWSKRALLLACFYSIAIVALTSAPSASARQSSPDEPGLFDPPPGDPWYSPPQQTRPPRGNTGDSLVSKSRIAPHWFHQNNRFWYRNDLGGGKREFILVDTADGKREPAFDHQKLAAGLTKASGASNILADKLPFDAVEFADDLKSVRFRMRETTWRCDLGTYACARAEGLLSSSSTTDGPANTGRNRAGRRDGGGPLRAGASDRSPDKKWTASIKDHNIYLHHEGEPAEIKLTTDGKADLAYSRLEWSSDSKTLVAWRIEPGERKDVYLIQSSPPGGGRAKLR